MRIIWSEIAQGTFVRFMADQAGMMAVNRAVEALADDPAPPGAFVRGAYRRLRVGPYRMLYAAAGRQDLVIVGQSYGAFTATLAANQLQARLLVLLAGMIPVPGESPGQWWASTGYRQAAEQQARLDGGKTGHDDPLISFYNGIPRPLAEEALRRGGRGESSVVWNTPWPLDAWPDVPTKLILCRDDQFLPAAFMRRVAQERLGTIPDEVPGCHCAALSHPRELTGLLVSYLD